MSAAEQAKILRSEGVLRARPEHPSSGGEDRIVRRGSRESRFGGTAGGQNWSKLVIEGEGKIEVHKRRRRREEEKVKKRRESEEENVKKRRRS